MAMPMCIPINKAQGFPFLHILASTSYLFDNNSSNRGEVIAHCDFDFSVINAVEHLSIYLLAICISSLEKCPFRSSA